MRDYVPFVNSARDCEIFGEYYVDAQMVRVSVGRVDEVRSLSKTAKIWIDAGVDGLHNLNVKSTGQFWDIFKKYPHYESIADPAFQSKPDKGVVETFVFAVLKHCAAARADYVSVPQLPHVMGGERNKINRLMCEATATWAVQNRSQFRFILPCIFTQQEQINTKSIRTKKLKLVDDCLRLSVATGVWVVESSLHDLEGAVTFEQRRFPKLIELHEELGSLLPKETMTIAGPYWGMNLVLWARGLVKFAAIGLGNAYQYHIPGGPPPPPANKRVALTALRRWAVASPDLKQWIQKNLNERISKTDPAHAQFLEVERLIERAMNSDDLGRRQIARFYKEWFDKIASAPHSGRALALYQDLSSAYVLGKTLTDLPKNEPGSRKPDRVARQLMLNCL